MIKLKDIIQEIGDGSVKGFQWQYQQESDHGHYQDYIYTFNGDKAVGIVAIGFVDNNEWDVAFGSIDKMTTNTDWTKLTNEGPFKVMATVTEIIKDFLDNTFAKYISDKNIKEDPSQLIPKKLSFNASKEKDVGVKGHGQRGKLYQAYLRKQFPSATISREYAGGNGDAYIIKL
tara:strand:- start:149 stop:670 length:522 start_codon:yes stop_codon:yes gene_type:complete